MRVSHGNEQGSGDSLGMSWTTEDVTLGGGVKALAGAEAELPQVAPQSGLNQSVPDSSVTALSPSRRSANVQALLQARTSP